MLAADYKQWVQKKNLAYIAVLTPWKNSFLSVNVFFLSLIAVIIVKKSNIKDATML